jgi:predicted DNA-binding ribbon-helix-helix protein
VGGKVLPRSRSLPAGGGDKLVATGRSRRLCVKRNQRYRGLTQFHAMPRKQSRVVKHAIIVSGRKSSVSLESEFWNALQEIAEANGMTRANLIREINKTRSHANLSSAIRLFVLAYYRGSGRYRPATRLGLSRRRRIDGAGGRLGGTDSRAGRAGTVRLVRIRNAHKVTPRRIVTWSPGSSYVRVMAAKDKQPFGPPMDLANMRRQGVRHLVAFCHNDACRHQAVIDVSKYPGDRSVTPLPRVRASFSC